MITSYQYTLGNSDEANRELKFFHHQDIGFNICLYKRVDEVWKYIRSINENSIDVEHKNLAELMRGIPQKISRFNDLDSNQKKAVLRSLRSRSVEIENSARLEAYRITIGPLP